MRVFKNFVVSLTLRSQAPECYYHGVFDILDFTVTQLEPRLVNGLKHFGVQDFEDISQQF